MPLPQPKGAQVDVLALPDRGHFVILGTAGSGKTTIAIYRALHLSELLMDDGDDHRILLLTFNNSLIRYFEFLTDEVPKNVDIRTYHKFGAGYLSSRGIVTNKNILGSLGKGSFIEEVLNNLKKSHPENGFFDKDPDFITEEISWIEKMGFDSFGEYKDTSRVGRGAARLKRGDRDWIYEIYSRYLDMRSERSYVCDWEDMGQLVYKTFRQDGSERMYKHLIIDEGQDFSPVMIRSLATAVPADGSLTFFGDVAQQIYGSRISWRDAGINISGRIHRFKQNYRNSPEISRYAMAISNLPFYNKSEDMVFPENVVAKGPKPVLVKFKSEETEIRGVGRISKNLANTGSIAILVRNNALEEIIISEIGARNCKKIERKMRYAEGGIWVGNFHAAKGLEFDSVILPFCSRDILPDPNRIASLGGEEEALSEEAKLVYVGVTRSKSNLAITYNGELSRLIPADPELITKREL